MKKKTILKDAVILLITTSLFISGITVTAKTNILENDNIEDGNNNLSLTREILFEDSFEDYEDWATEFPPWTTIDVDQNPTFGHTGFNFPIETLPYAWAIFNPSACDPPQTEEALQPHTGEKMTCCWAADGTWQNDDWLITPLMETANFDEVIFWAHSYSDAYNLERLEVGISTTDTNPESFTIISDPPYIELPLEWTEYSFNLDDYDWQSIYIGIHGVSYDSWILFLDDFSVTGSLYPPLVADADGPYEAFEEESIQFQGSATGGLEPYSFHWDFGDGETSDEQNPEYTYDIPDVYEVTLTVTDSTENTAQDTTTATINEKPCCFEVLIPPGFGIGLKAEVTEICDESHTKVPWEFTITGGLFVTSISPLTGHADFAAGETKTLKALLVIGLGSIQITFTISDNCDPTTVNAFIIGPFVIVS